MRTRPDRLMACPGTRRSRSGSHYIRHRQSPYQSSLLVCSVRRMADVNYNTIRAIRGNEMKDVTVGTLEKIARALEVDVSELIEVLPDE